MFLRPISIFIFLTTWCLLLVSSTDISLSCHSSMGAFIFVSQALISFTLPVLFFPRTLFFQDFASFSSIDFSTVSTHSVEESLVSCFTHAYPRPRSSRISFFSFDQERTCLSFSLFSSQNFFVRLPSHHYQDCSPVP